MTKGVDHTKFKKVKNFFNKYYNIPNSWKYPKFASLVKTNPRTTINTKFAAYVPMNSVNTNNSKVNYFERRKVSDTSNLPKFLENDVLFARITPSTENGKTALIENFQEVGIASSELTVLRCNHKILPKYLYYYMKSYRIRSFAISQMLGTTNRQRVPEYVFEKDLNFELPPLSEQQKIASILSGVDALIESTQHIIEKTERLKKSLMQKLLTRGIGHTKFKKIKWLFGKEIEIPEKWKIYTIDNLIRNKKDVKTGPFGSNLKKETFVLNGCKVYGQENVIPNNFLIGNYYISQEHFDKLKEYEIKPNDILISLVGTHSKISLVPMGIKKGIINPRLLRIRFNTSKAIPNFMKILLNFNFTELQIKKFAHGLTMEIINTAVLRKIVFFIPNIDEQQKIASILSGVDAIKHHNIIALITLRIKLAIFLTFFVWILGSWIQQYRKKPTPLS